MKALVLSLVAMAGIALIGCSSQEETSASPSTEANNMKVTPTFASVGPLMQKRCVGCHGENGKDGIDLRTYESVMKGGEPGPIIVPGDAAASLLVKALKGDGVKQMPLNQTPLTAEEIAIVEGWINAGAKM